MESDWDPCELNEGLEQEMSKARDETMDYWSSGEIETDSKVDDRVGHRPINLILSPGSVRP